MDVVKPIEGVPKVDNPFIVEIFDKLPKHINWRRCFFQIVKLFTTHLFDTIKEMSGDKSWTRTPTMSIPEIYPTLNVRIMDYFFDLRKKTHYDDAETTKRYTKDLTEFDHIIRTQEEAIISLKWMKSNNELIQILIDVWYVFMNLKLAVLSILPDEKYIKDMVPFFDLVYAIYVAYDISK